LTNVPDFENHLQHHHPATGNPPMTAETMTDTPLRTLTLGHSPDPDDAFMFYALAKDKIDTGGLAFEHILQDIQKLNERATRGELDITAISVHAYAFVADKYAVLPHGASMGDNYGPMIVAREAIDPADLAKREIAVPGEMTSAFLALRLWYALRGVREFRYRVVPFDQIMGAVERGEVDGGLLIHEGQLTFEAAGMTSIVNLGEWWYERTAGLPLPLGCNAIRRDLGRDLIAKTARLLRQSIQYSLDHRAPALEYALNWARDMEVHLADEFVGMYVNDLTLDYGDRGREAIRRFLDESFEQGLLPHRVAMEFVDETTGDASS
jgi:1,4-dihydroxy-6-naphthoate synthase